MIKPDSLFITINGKRSNLNDFPNLNLAIHKVSNPLNSKDIFELCLANSGGAAKEISAVELVFNSSSFFQDEPDSYLFYKEGLTVVGVAGARGKDDCDFELDPGFLRITVSDPSAYSWQKKGIFCAEQIGVLQNERTGKCVLAGFVTCKSFLCRIVMDMNNSMLSAIIETKPVVLKPNEEMKLENLMVAYGDDVEELLELYAQGTASMMESRYFLEIPKGWCSYYYYYGQETEDDILENARFLSDVRNGIHVEYIQIDDGWQKARGDWTESHAVKFPHGMQWLADRIKGLGFKPGIWVAPFLVSRSSDTFRMHQDWLLRNRNGELLEMGSDCFLDASHPDALKWLAECFRTMKKWGYTYFKLDFMIVETCYEAQYHDRNISRVQAYRQGLSAIREAVGDDAFILGGTALVTPNVGFVDACRISTDVTPYWCMPIHTPESPAIFNVCRNIINHGYMNGRLWINDPDCLIVREYHNREKYKDIPPLTLLETLTLATSMIMSGGSLFLGDRMEKLPAERLDIIRKVLSLMSSTAACPVDRMDGEIPRIWFRKENGTKEKPHLLAVYNWSSCTETITVRCIDLKLGQWNVRGLEDVWTGEDISDMSIKSIWDFTLPPHACRLIKIYTGE